MKIKLTEPGFTKMTGEIGDIEFKDGVSVDDVSRTQMNRIGSAMRVERLDGGIVTEAERYTKSKQESAPMLEKLATGTVVDEKSPDEDEVKSPDEDEVKSSDEDEVKSPDEDEVKSSDEDPVASLTKDELSKIADEKGIAGLREVAEGFGVKSKSIPDLIEKILAAQAKPTK